MRVLVTSLHLSIPLLLLPLPVHYEIREDAERAKDLDMLKT